MAPKYKTTTSLVIVESPAKCKKIEEYLGPGYKCIASYGHLRELPSLQNIDIQNGFEPTYTNIDNEFKRRQIYNLKEEIKKAGDVILALDDDREGESIAWHICKMFHLNIEKTKRIVFHEITEKAIQHAINNPRTICMNTVNAQQTRQILDVLVGFKVSPILWKYVAKNTKHPLSAGRCQTPALKIVYENQKEIDASPGVKVYKTIGYFTNLCIPFELKKDYQNEEDVIQFLNESVSFSHVYNCGKPEKVYKTPPEPFTTSRLQQVSSNKLHISPNETMKLCQKLYEEGFITYMRTDSKKYSKDFLETTKKFIEKTYGANYIHQNIDLLSNDVERKENDHQIQEEDSPTKKKKSVKTKDKKKTENNHAQEAHEAIRPTNLSLKEIPDSFETKERKMYKLIWENYLESCMSNASYFSVTANIKAFDNNTFSYSCEQIDFPGWKIVSNEKPKKEEQNYFQYLQSITPNQILFYKKIYSKSCLINTKSHLTEAKLVQLLEEKGIGRPSTFSMLIEKIQEREYVKKMDVLGKQITCKDFELEGDTVFEVETTREIGNEKNKLVIQPLGVIVIEFLEKHFQDIFQYDYTREMEEDLDKICNGLKEWVSVCKNCNENIDSFINKLSDFKKIEIPIDEKHFFIIGKNGPVIKCVEENNITFKSVRKDIDIHLLEKGGYKLEDIILDDVKKDKHNEIILGMLEDEQVVLRKGKFGLYITWGEKTKTLKELGNRPIESITLEDVKTILNDNNSGIVREISDNITIRKSKKGEDYIFYKTPKMRKPQFFAIGAFLSEEKNDYRSCDIKLLKQWISETYHIS